MAWVWTDEIAADLARAGLADTIVGELVMAPIGFAVPDGEDPVGWAAALLGLSPTDSEETAPLAEAG